MPGAQMQSVSGAFAFGLAIPAYPTAFTLLSGHLLHQVKLSRLRGAERGITYFLAYFVFLIPNLPILFLYILADEPFPFYFFAVVTAALVLALRYAPPDKRWRAYLPGMGVGAFFLVFNVLGTIDTYHRLEEKKIERELDRAELTKDYDEETARLRHQDSHILADELPNPETFTAVALPGEFVPGEILIPVPPDFTHTPIPRGTAKEGEEAAFFHRAFRDAQNNGFSVILWKGADPKKVAARWSFQDVAIDRPFFEASLYQHFRNNPDIYSTVSAALLRFFRDPTLRYNQEWRIPSDRNPFLADQPLRVVHYDGRIVVSRFPASIRVPSGDGTIVVRRVDLYFASFLIADGPVECLLAIDPEAPLADASLPLGWINASQRLNADRPAANPTDAAASRP